MAVPPAFHNSAARVHRVKPGEDVLDG
jgi:hypothetical protein